MTTTTEYEKAIKEQTIGRWLDACPVAATSEIHAAGTAMVEAALAVNKVKAIVAELRTAIAQAAHKGVSVSITAKEYARSVGFENGVGRAVWSIPDVKVSFNIRFAFLEELGLTEKQLA